MAGKHNIRITANDRADYKRLRRNVTSKINRTRKNFGIDISDRITLPSITDFNKRSEFNKWKEQARQFTNKSNLEYQFVINDNGVVASKKELKQIERDNKRAIKRAKSLVDKAMKQPFIQGGEQYGTVESRIKQLAINRMTPEEIAGISIPKPFDFNKVNSKERLEDVKSHNRDRATGKHYVKRNENLKNNFITMMEQAFGSESDDIVRRIKEIPANDFVEMSIMFDELDIRTYESKRDGDFNDIDRMYQIEQYLDMYDNKTIDFKLQNF